MPARPIVHVVFGYSAAGSLMKALATLGRTDRVIFSGDDLSIGPLRTLDNRWRWLATVGWWDERGRVRRFWREVACPEHRVVVWMSSRDACERAGSYELLRRREDTRSVRVVDVAEHALTTASGTPSSIASQSFAYVSDAAIVRHDLVERAVPVDSATIARRRARWAALRSENGVVRIVEDDELVTVPVTYHDAAILDHASVWRPRVRLLGETVGRLPDRIAESFIDWRIDRLLDKRVLEQRQDPERPDGWQVRARRSR